MTLGATLVPVIVMCAGVRHQGQSPDRRSRIPETSLTSAARTNSQLARAALSGDEISDCDPDAFEDGGLGAAAYADRSQAPEAAFRASLGGGNPLTVAGLRPRETVLDLGSGGGPELVQHLPRLSALS